jgi:hypothetical protein
MSEWSQEGQRLEQLLTPEELESARATTLNAHYTAPGVISAMYDALRRLGFSQGRVLEPALGLGHFIGLMPDDMHARTRITGIEIDSVTARLARLLYPDADIRHKPFEESVLPDGGFDAAIGNIPFGDYKPFDPRFKGLELSHPRLLLRGDLGKGAPRRPDHVHHVKGHTGQAATLRCGNMCHSKPTWSVPSACPTTPSRKTPTRR